MCQHCVYRKHEDSAFREGQPEPESKRTRYLNSLAADMPDITLDPNDPFERVLIDIVATNRKKRADYALDGSPFSNFEFTSEVMGFTSVEGSAVFNVAQKLARLSSLNRNRRKPQNETVEDTYLDMACYAIIAYAIYKDRTSKDANS